MILVIVTVLNQRATKVPLGKANSATLVAERMADNLKAESEVVQALGMREAGFTRWQRARGASLSESINAAEIGRAHV